jgi:hypothetical protein
VPIKPQQPSFMSDLDVQLPSAFGMFPLSMFSYALASYSMLQLFYSISECCVEIKHEQVHIEYASDLVLIH